MKIIIYELGTHHRAKLIADAMSSGLRRHGMDVRRQKFFDGVEGDLAVAYGWNHSHVFSAYEQYLYFDLGYWNRRPQGSPKEGHHRVAVSSWCPSVNMMRGCPVDRLERSGLVIAEKPNGNNGILVADMSLKAAAARGFPSVSWGLNAIETLRGVTSRPVYHRPKPGKNERAPTIEEALSLCSSVACYCSNVAVDGIISGCSVFAEQGIGRLVSVPTLTDIATAEPLSYEERRAFLADVAYCQWSPAEMRSGDAWDYLKGLIK